MNDEYEDLAEMYRPQGACARCPHPATDLWFLSVGSQRFEFRCSCCVALGKLERAQRAADRIPKLKEEYAKAVAECR